MQETDLSITAHTPSVSAETPDRSLSPFAASQPAPVQEENTGGTFSAMKDSLLLNNLKIDKSLGAVLAYLVIAQFGVFSSMTIPAPSFFVGFAFFAAL
jgi:hypothetical protein